ncbi:FAD binding protein domain containing protein [Sporothrix schenckii 1099-18]|uniref:FAD binding protein domain containing protein n=1 Tax=Sporothrix schenckii 1099-18 TaxID=1397361 RepID=A0A0F2M7R7_SPOSC|nr:FAD binding protein domain containing protein [Sporothrix schenckii 1099-18]KJR85682.1 FAD binding protein domain containing protein [Sporothrix schenckii 1099-18]
MSSLPSECDVLVVGGGNAGFSAAFSARENGARNVVLIDKCPEEWAGGNTYFTAGAFRTAHAGLADLLPLVNNVDAATSKIIDLEPYTPHDFTSDLLRVTAGRSDPQLGSTLVGDSNDAVKWLHKHSVRFQLSFNRQSYKVDGRYKFWGGMALKTQDGGKGLMEDLRRAAKRAGVATFFSTMAKQLVTNAEGTVTGVVVASTDSSSTHSTSSISAKAVILTAGGFEANPRMRAQYLGPGWDLALVRGTPYNTGDGLEFAMRDVGAKQAGHWSGCHSVAWDAHAPANSGDRAVSNEFTKSGYPLGVMINTQGERFVDEGVDLRNYTYAKFGHAIMGQPDGQAFQVWDARGTPWLRDEEYRDSIVRKIRADTLEELADKLARDEGLHSPAKFLETMHDYNAAANDFQAEHPHAKWDPAVRDGVSTQSSRGGLALPKSNWALPIDKGPFVAVKVACGVTFTFGGLAVNPQTAAVVAASNREVPGLFCAGEMLGGLFYGNYPGGSGLTSGTVFGRRAGRAAAQRAKALSSVRSNL